MTLPSAGGRGASVLYHTPHSPHFTRLTRQSPPRTFAKLGDVPLTGGYMVVPFETSEATPIVLIEPDHTEELPLAHTGPGGTADLAEEDEAEERGRYAQAFAATEKLLKEGKLQKMVLSRRLRCTHPRHPDTEALFLKACHCRPDHFVALWSTPQTGTWLVATPEPILEKRLHAYHTVALAGTTPFKEGETPLWSKKNREEQAIVARYVHALLRETATDVQASATYPFRTGDICHLRTDFRFRLAHDTDARQVLARLHPTPAVCGLPCGEALRAIRETEASPRRYYAGFSGPFRLNGETRLFVSLRCMEIGDTVSTLYAGGGIMPESEEADEWEETQRKLDTMRLLYKGAARQTEP